MSESVFVTERDVAMLHSISEAGFLTAFGLEWLHFPERRAAWEQWDATKGCYQVSRALQRRLQTLVRGGYLAAITRPEPRSKTFTGRRPNAYYLVDRGAYVLAERRGDDLTSLHYMRERARSTYLLEHYVQSATFYAALRAKIEAMEDVTMQDWLSEHRTAKGYDQVSVRRNNAQGGTDVVKLPIQPDGTFKLIHKGHAWRVFLEVDRGTRRIETWREKIAAYNAYDHSRELRQRYQAETFLLLVCASDALHRQRLMEATALELGAPNGRYLFCLADDVHPLTIGSAWQKISDLQFERVIGVTGKAHQKAVIHIQSHQLLR